MKYSNEKLRKIFDKTDGHCHICNKKLCFNNYGRFDYRAPWEVDHSVPESLGGSDHLNNLLPVCISCNRSKQNRSTKSVRAVHGRTRAPISKKERKHQEKVQNCIIAAVFFLTLLIIGINKGSSALESRNNNYWV